MLLVAANGPESWIWWDWVARHGDEIWLRTREHVFLTVVAVLLGTMLAVPAAVVASRVRALATPLLVIGGVLYTIPSLALFALLVPFTGLSRKTPLIALTIYSLLMLFRNALTGLQTVPDDVRDAATGMGYSWRRQLWSVELPLALPSIFAGIRIASVTTIGLVTVAALVAQGGYGQFILDGYERSFRTPIVLGTVLSIGLALIVDLALVGAQRALTPWARTEDVRPR